MIDSTHCDTIINGKHIIVDTIYKNDTVFVERTLFDKEFEIINKFMEKPDFGGQVVSVLILMFVAYSLWAKWNCKK
jgi:hypothetical protein